MNADIMITTGYDFDGYIIDKYMGVFSGECVLGTGFLSSLGAGFADIFGTNSSMYSEKLKKAKDFAIDQLIKQVLSVGANAIIGLDIDYTSFSDDIMGVIVSGTAVKITTSAIKTHLPQILVTNYNPYLPVRPHHIDIFLQNGNCFSRLYITDSYLNELNISVLHTDVNFKTVFGDTISFEDIYFQGFTKERHFFVSNSVKTPISDNLLGIIDSTTVEIKRYINCGEIKEVSSCKTFSEGTDNFSQNILSSKTTLFDQLESLESASGIFKYLSSREPNTVHPEALDIARTSLNLEKLYGNMKEDCIRKIKAFYNSIE